MSRSSLTLLLQLLAAPISGIAGLANSQLEVTPGTDGGTVVLSQIVERSRAFHQFRPVGADSSAALFEEDASEGGGFQIGIHRKDAGDAAIPEWLRWAQSASEGRCLNFKSDPAGLELTLELPEEGSYLDVSLKGSAGEGWESIDLSWLLEVAGDFLGVPTESPSDTLVMPVKAQGLLVQQIGYSHQKTFRPASNWWAVVDRIKRFALAVEVREGPGFELHQWSGKIGALDALRETMRFPVAAGGAINLRIRLLILPSADHLSALGEGIAFSVVPDPQQPKRSVLFVMAGRPVRNAHIKVRTVGDAPRELISLPLERIDPDRPHRLALPEESVSPLELEWQEKGESYTLLLVLE